MSRGLLACVALWVSTAEPFLVREELVGDRDDANIAKCGPHHHRHRPPFRTAASRQAVDRTAWLQGASLKRPRPRGRHPWQPRAQTLCVCAQSESPIHRVAHGSSTTSRFFGRQSPIDASGCCSTTAVKVLYHSNELLETPASARPPRFSPSPRCRCNSV